MANRSTVITTYEEYKRMGKTNEEHVETIVATFLPDLYRVWGVLKVYNINTEVLPAIIKAIADICYSSKSGKVIIEIEPDSVTGRAQIKAIKGLDVYKIKIDADLNP